jgi:hypothetical protein
MTTTIVKERPILFSGPMVRAILDGKKTQTRRVIQFPKRGAFVIEDRGNGWEVFQSDDGESSLCNDGNEHPMRCPYGYEGDRLWVKETFRTVGRRHRGTERRRVIYPATCAPGTVRPPLKPSIFMPRWASRITLDVVGVRVERLQDISAEDVYAEGVGAFVQSNIDVAREMFARLWNSINEERGFGWERNPWVWAIEFGRHVS